MKSKIAVAARPLKPKDMSRNHYTTLGFGTPFPVYVEETIPRDKFTFQVHNFSRLAPMLLPNLGTINLKVHSFYVPFHMVWNHFENFVNGLPSWNSNGAQVYKHTPMIDDICFTQLFILGGNPSGNLATLVTSSSADGGYDFAVQANDSTINTYKFTLRGKQIYHMLLGLGYNFNFTVRSADSERYSALPLLCWLKIFLDYFIPSQLQPSSAINQLLSKIHDYTAAQMESPLGYQDLDVLLQEIYLYYQNNYFTSAWQNPNSVVTGLNNIGSTTTDRPVINSISAQGSQFTGASATLNNVTQPLVSTNNGVYLNPNANINPDASAVPGTFSADGLSMMQKFARYVKRSNFAGSRAVERILARFGVRIDDFQIGMCKYLGSDTVPLQKSDVVVTGSTEQSGDYTGKGWFSGGSRTFKCNCDFAGMIIVTASLETPSTFTDGVRRRNLHMQPLDFYTPELDGGVMQAISGQELFGRVLNGTYDVFSNLSTLGLRRSSVFGFTPRYSEYKNGAQIDDITGDFSLPRFAQNIDGFILPRRIFDTNLRYQDTVDDPDNLTAPYSDYAYDEVIATGQRAITPVQSLFMNDSDQFNRIFRDTSGDADPVFSVFRIDCVCNSCSLPLNESSELIGKGKLLDFETNGVHLS